PRSQQRAAGAALIKILAGVHRHCFGSCRPAGGTGEHRCQNQRHGCHRLPGSRANAKRISRRPVVPLAAISTPTVPRIHTRTRTLASGLWISDRTVAVIADTAKPAVSVARTGLSGAE